MGFSRIRFPRAWSHFVGEADMGILWLLSSQRFTYFMSSSGYHVDQVKDHLHFDLASLWRKPCSILLLQVSNSHRKKKRKKAGSGTCLDLSLKEQT